MKENLIEKLKITPVSMIDRSGRQRINISCYTSADLHVYLNVLKNNKRIIKKEPLNLRSGKCNSHIMLKAPDKDFEAVWQIVDESDNIIAEKKLLWKKPREWTLYVMISSHTDIGLHNSQYIQRYNSALFLDKAMALCDETDGREPENRYRYIVEGTWFFNNYEAERGKAAAKRLVEKYIKTGKIGVCAGIAGNHTQVYGLEEMCRSTYSKRRLNEKWNLNPRTMTMIDNNGLSWAVVQPYSDAGIENIIFAPNQWNPLPSTVWTRDSDVDSFIWNPNAAGGGSRIDIRYESRLPMVFYWQGDDESKKILVWGNISYDSGSGAVFGIRPKMNADINSLTSMEFCVSKQIDIMDRTLPYDVWLFTCYSDDQEPSLGITDSLKLWNEKWQWPKIQTLGNPDEPFEILKSRFDKEIPVLRGDITGGWYQHPVSAPELLAKKSEADRLLPTAEKLSTIAAVIDGTYLYPETEYERAWDALLFNDEHSYGTSGYQGRRVYETWMQHNDWIAKAEETAKCESEAALKAISKHITSNGKSVAVFNPTLLTRSELVEYNEKRLYVEDIPPLGYKTVPLKDFKNSREATALTEPPVIESRYYKLKFNKNGSVSSVFDKEQKRELLERDCEFSFNEFIYTNDNHKTFFTPKSAEFELIKEAEKISVKVTANEEISGASAVFTISLPEYEKRIDIDNSLYHVKDLYNKNRYYRYCYFAFPFDVKNARRYCHLNGCAAEYAKDVTGHGTDVYMAANEWCCAENKDFGIALFQQDSELIEFDRIHKDKTDFGFAGDSSGIYSYVANDWLQMHVAGGSHINFRFRYSVTSYKGGYRKANVYGLAERMSNPVLTVPVPKQKKELPGIYSFMSVKEDLRLLTLKKADDSNGLLARFYTNGKKVPAEVTVKTPFSDNVKICVNSTSEGKADISSVKGFLTVRLDIGKTLSVRKEKREKSTPAPIGSVYTGLISKPAAASGEDSGMLYLLWGRNTEKNFAYYELYRSETGGFEPNESNFIAEVMPEEYVCGRYIDRNLKEHTRYYYRVRAVSKSGKKGAFSDEFSGITKETV